MKARLSKRSRFRLIDEIWWATAFALSATGPFKPQGIPRSIGIRVKMQGIGSPYVFRKAFRAWVVLVVTICGIAHASPRIVAWGDNTYGQTNVPTQLTNVVAIAQGGMHGLGLSGEGLVTAWGYNYTATTPTTFEGQAIIPAGLSNVTAIAAGYDSSLALKNDGTIAFWGDTGQTNLPGGLTNIIAIAAGELHSLVQRSDGGLVAWGNNANGQTNVPPLATNIAAVAAGGFNSLIIQSNHTVLEWGWNGYGQDSPPATATNIIEAALGLYHTVALRGDGTVVAWGYNGYGQTNVPAGLSNVVHVAAGWDHSLALRRDGTVIAWGYNNAGQSTIPIGLSNVVAISASRYQSLALANDGSPWIAQQPSDKTLFSGMNCSFSVRVIGTTNVNYQWCLDGVNIPGATNASLSLTNVQTMDSGNYTVILSNAIGVVISSNAVLAVSNSPPIITLPVQMTVLSHSNAMIPAVTAGSFPQFYQWQFKGTNIARATNAFLSLTNVQVTDSGNYSMIITNAYGSTTGLVASLAVIDLGASLNATNLVWTTTGSNPWFPETDTNHDGSFAAQSAAPAYPQPSTLQTSVTGPGTLTFWAQCYRIGDLYSFSASGSFAQTNYIPSFGGRWLQETVYLGSGTQTLQWTFQKSFFATSGLHAAWLDEVSFVAGATPVTVTSMTSDQILPAGSNVAFSVSALGTPPLSYQWSFNGNALFGQTNASLSLTNVQLTNAGNYAVTITNGYGLPVTTNAMLLVQQPQFDGSAGNAFMGSEGFNFRLGGLTGHGPVIIFASTDLLSWLPILTNPPTTNVLQILDTNAACLPSRYYRAAEQ